MAAKTTTTTASVRIERNTQNSFHDETTRIRMMRATPEKRGSSKRCFAFVPVFKIP